MSEATSASEDPERAMGMTDAAALSSAVSKVHAALDAWHAAVEGVAAESGGDPTEALADPRLEAAQDAFYERLGAFEAAALPVLGLIEVGRDGGDDDEEGAAEDDFFVHVVVGVPDGDPPDRLRAAFEVVSDASTALGSRLTSEGFVVRHVAASRGELDLDDGDEEDVR